ncbi:MAG: trypsin-like peptidase domain-containing protein [Deferribacteraceae bacterium]|jgi:serine protease Do|nr:trypsin-like peptidase domain-containing protein [Deferribacteraceae bacterium]
MRRFIGFTAVFLLIAIPLSAREQRVTPVVRAVNSVQDSVVNIRVDTLKRRQGPWGDPFFDEFMGFGGTYKSQSVGTGVVFDSSGLVVTNYHVISDATSIAIFTRDNRQFSARFIGGDEALDVAVLAIDNAGLSPVKLGSSADIMPGETVIAIGNPYGLSSSVTTGVVSGSRRLVKVGSSYSIFIQTDALINPGNSGGPLINLDGEVIGINTAMYRDAQGIGFAIPIDAVRRIVPELVRYKSIRQGHLGFSVYSGDGRLVVGAVEAGSEAAKKGVKKGDILISLDDLPVNSLDSVSHILRTFPPGQSLSAVFERNGRRISLALSLAGAPINYGIELLKSRYGIEAAETGHGLIIKQSSYPRYIKQGDYLTAVNGIPVKSAADINRALPQTDSEIKVRISSGGRSFELILK